MSSSMERSFMTNPLISIWNNMKKKLTTGQGEDYITAGCLLDYEYTKNHYRNYNDLKIRS